MKILKKTIQIRSLNIYQIWWYDYWFACQYKLSEIATKLFITDIKLNVSLVFITQYFRIDSAHHFNLKIPNKLELQQTAFNYSSDIDIKDFMNLYK